MSFFEARYRVEPLGVTELDQVYWDDSARYRAAKLRHACNWAMQLSAAVVRDGEDSVVRVYDQVDHKEIFKVHARHE